MPLALDVITPGGVRLHVWTDAPWAIITENRAGHPPMHWLLPEED